MQFGLNFCNNRRAAEDPSFAANLARAAEQSGFESIWAGEHVVMPGAISSRYPFSKDGTRTSRGRTEDMPIADPLVWLAFLAGNVQSLQLGTGVLILPEHHPVRLAKAVASLDRLSNERVILGVGIGWMREEYEILGIPWEKRIDRFEEYVTLIRLLWTEQSVSFHGQFYSFEAAKSFPQPRRPGGVPILFGGQSRGAAERAGRLGDGFMPACTPDLLSEMPDLLASFRRAAEEAGRDPSALEISVTLPHPETDLDHAVGVLAELAVDRVMISVQEPTLDATLDSMAEKADVLRRAVGACRAAAPSTGQNPELATT